MKIICYANATSANDPLAAILQGEGYDVLNTNSESVLRKAIRSNGYVSPVVLYRISNDNFADCYRSLNGLLRLRPGSQTKPEVIVLADDSVEEEAVELLKGMTSSILSTPVEVDAILAKLHKLKGYKLKSEENGNEEQAKFHELLDAMKAQLTSIRGALLDKESLKENEQKILKNLQHQISKLDKHLNHNKKLSGLKHITPKLLIKKILQQIGWSEVVYRESLSETKVEVDYEYFEKALGDLIDKITQVAGSADNLSVIEMVQTEYLCVSFAIQIIDTSKALDLLNYKNFDFCQQILSLHAGEFFIKYDGEDAYITIRLPIAQ